MKLMRQKKRRAVPDKPRSIVDDVKTFEVALHCYFGLSDYAIMNNMRGMTKGRIAYRVKKARERYNLLVKRSDYRDGRNALSKKALRQFRGFAEHQLQIGDLK